MSSTNSICKSECAFIQKAPHQFEDDQRKITSNKDKYHLSIYSVLFAWAEPFSYKLPAVNRCELGTPKVCFTEHTERRYTGKQHQETRWKYNYLQSSGLKK